MPKLKVYNGWTLDEALTLIRQYQYGFHSLKFHVALGGGVLNNGTSIHDLDLYVLPFSDSEYYTEIKEYLRSIFTYIGPIGDARYKDTRFNAKEMYEYQDKRIDVFIV